MIKTRRKFDRQFKLRAVELSYQRDNVKALADEFEIRPELLYRWRSEFATDERISFPGNGKFKHVGVSYSENSVCWIWHGNEI